ncbi:hypothetical protein [Gordonia sp. NB41Y]|uniref:hypothetical protein n=1 Tax=Gordonia sp. NB41Y TaxID=875808 RepID=UPI00128E9675|nr:hypothetical protein [Gordonia sp. NB41Y]WLP88439.1 hypothetical protein Q9K23_12415 [Gordonia sp. NB41Y]
MSGESLVGAYSVVTAAVVAQALRTTRLIVEVSPEPERPFSIARRSASLHMLHHGRARDIVLARGTGSPPDHLGDKDIHDAAALIYDLWRTWPIQSIVGDTDRGVYADASRLTTVSGHGRYHSAGPLPVPLDPADLPTIHQWDTAPTTTGHRRIRAIPDPDQTPDTDLESASKPSTPLNIPWQSVVDLSDLDDRAAVDTLGSFPAHHATH